MTQDKRTTQHSGAWTRLRDLSVQTIPLGPLAMRLKNRREMQRRVCELAALGLPTPLTAQELQPDLVELCGYYARVMPENAHFWQRAAEMADAHAEGPAAVLDLVRKWGFVRNAKGGLEVPNWWSRLVVPLEFMDYSKERYPSEALLTAGIDPERFHTLARKASDAIWMGYYIAKGSLCYDGVSLLIREITGAIHAVAQRVPKPANGPLPIYVVGLSEDEVTALRGPGLSVVGFNLGLSPVLESMVQKGQVRRVVARRDGIATERLLDAVTLEPIHFASGGCYVCECDVAREGLPVPAASGLAMVNEALHHNSYEDQAAIIRELHRVALPVPGGGRGWIAGELFRVVDFPRMLIGLSTACGPTLWDAWVSFANGIACVEELMRRQDEWAAEGVQLHFRYVPSGLVGAPALLHQLVMCPTQVLISGY